LSSSIPKFYKILGVSMRMGESNGEQFISFSIQSKFFEDIASDNTTPNNSLIGIIPTPN